MARRTLALAASGLLTFSSHAALAQVAGAPSGAATSAPSATTAAAPTNGSAVDEIVVTAQKRSENVQKTSAAVTVLTGAALTQQGVTDLRGVEQVVPSARFQQEGNSTQVFLRGIGANLDLANIEQSVAFNVNGVFIPREGTSVALFDLDRIEVLPGPQGTLYGRSAIGGAVNASFKRPTNDVSGDGLLEVGNYDLAHLSLAQNLPITADLSARIAIDYTYRDGYLSDGSDNQNDFAGRLGAVYKPDSKLSVYVWGLAVRKFGNPANLVNKGFDPATGTISENAFLHSDPYDTSRTGALAPFAPFGQSSPSPQKYEEYVGGAEVSYALGRGLTLTYVPSYLYLNSSVYKYYLGALPASSINKYHQVTQELRLSGDTPRFKWLAGLYGYQSINSGFGQILLGTPLVFLSEDVSRNQLEGLAVFGQGTYSLTDALRFTFGGRYSADNRNGRGISPLNLQPFSSVNTYYHTDYKFGLEYDLAPRILTYVTYQTGYQPGTYNQVAATPTASNIVEAETIDSITGGFKSRFFNGRLQINDEAFYYKYNNLFIQAFNEAVAYNPIFNARRVEIPGDQLDIIFKPASDDQVSASVSYIHARDTDFITPTGQNFDGFSPPYAADWTTNVAYAHDFRFGFGRLHAAADARYESPFFADFVHNPGTRQSAYVKENTELTYYPRAGDWSLGFWIKNISNKAVIAATAEAGIPGPATAYLEAPRTFGGRLTVHY